MSPSTRARRASTCPRPTARRSLTALLAVAVAATLMAGPALALPTDSTPVPTPPAPVLNHPCPTGSTPTQVTAPPPPSPPAPSPPAPPTPAPPSPPALPAPPSPPAPLTPAPPSPPAPPNPPTPNPSVTTQPDGSVITTTCAVAPPTPFSGPKISPATTVGGPRLAAPGVIVDAPSSVPAPPVVTDVSYVISDLATGEVLAAKDPHALLPPASTLKTLTALVTLPVLSPSTAVTASREAATVDGTRVGMIEGNPYTVDQLFAGLILVSGNDTAYALADAYGGRAKTLAAMNQRAHDLGAWDTVAKDPSGLDTDGQQSSAYDLSLFGRAVMQLPAFRRYAVLKDFTFPGGTNQQGKAFPPFQIANHNTLLENYPGTIGVKNGYTSGARHTFIGAVTRGERTLLITQMGGVVIPTWQPTAALLDWAFANAGQLQPVGRLVPPGVPQPPEWRGETSTPSTTAAPTTATPTTAAAPTTATPTTAASTTTAAPASAQTSTAPGATPPALAAGPTRPPSAAGGNPFSGLLASTQTGGSQPAAYAVLAVALAALAGWVVARRRRRRRA